MASLVDALGWFTPKEVARKVREGYRLQERTFADVLNLDDSQLSDLLSSQYLFREAERTLQTPIRIVGMITYSLSHPLVHFRANSRISDYIPSPKIRQMN
ncbi:hypothetical protein HY212_04385 [Candidatus Pacearchaeota archaeon]|nr:hypothetical protein [Candidatus Pacearchaeota archaeon]